jgi:hypothetical protein
LPGGRVFDFLQFEPILLADGRYLALSGPHLAISLDAKSIRLQLIKFVEVIADLCGKKNSFIGGFISCEAIPGAPGGAINVRLL